MAADRSQGGCPFGRITRFVQREGTRIVVGFVGGVIVIAGVVLMPLPGPGILVVLAGLAILGTQFEWAQDLLDRARTRARDALDRIRGRDGDEHDEADGVDGERAPTDAGASAATPSAHHPDPGAVGGRSDGA